MPGPPAWTCPPPPRFWRVALPSYPCRYTLSGAVHSRLPRSHAVWWLLGLAGREGCVSGGVEGTWLWLFGLFRVCLRDGRRGGGGPSCTPQLRCPRARCLVHLLSPMHASAGSGGWWEGGGAMDGHGHTTHTGSCREGLWGHLLDCVPEGHRSPSGPAYPVKA
jgi:hypothetical protein